MKLRDLVSRLPDKIVLGDPFVEVTGLAYHSREVKEGNLFAAMRGLRADGKQFIPEALSRGARSFLVEEAAEGIGATQVVVPRVREALAYVASAFLDDPSLSLTVIGITGTNGKTTTSYLLESILSEAGKKVGVVGTVNYRYAGQVRPAATTTPESLDLQRLLAGMREAGVTHAVLEVSSHALDMQRVKGCNFDVALFTNLTRDHLDYHGSMEKYFQAKELLFTEALRESRKKNRFSVINSDDPRGEDLRRSASGTIFRYGVKSRGEVYPKRFSGDLDGIRAEIVTPRGELEIASPLIGLHNLYNILAAVGVGRGAGNSRRGHCPRGGKDGAGSGKAGSGSGGRRDPDLCRLCPHPGCPRAGPGNPALRQPGAPPRDLRVRRGPGSGQETRHGQGRRPRK